MEIRRDNYYNLNNGKVIKVLEEVKYNGVQYVLAVYINENIEIEKYNVYKIDNLTFKEIDDNLELVEVYKLFLDKISDFNGSEKEVIRDLLNSFNDK